LKDLMLDYLNAKRIKDGGFFQFDPIEKMMALHLRQKENFSHQLWALLVFEMWRENYL